MASYTLSIEHHGAPAKSLKISTKRARLGRTSGDVVLGDPHASSQHGEINFSGGILTYLDLGSSNGSFDDKGELIQGPYPLRLGTTLRIGDTVLTVKEIQSDAPPVQKSQKPKGGAKPAERERKPAQAGDATFAIPTPRIGEQPSVQRAAAQPAAKSPAPMPAASKATGATVATRYLGMPEIGGQALTEGSPKGPSGIPKTSLAGSPADGVRADVHQGDPSLDLKAKKQAEKQAKKAQAQALKAERSAEKAARKAAAAVAPGAEGSQSPAAGPAGERKGIAVPGQGLGGMPAVPKFNLPKVAFSWNPKSMEWPTKDGFLGAMKGFVAAVVLGIRSGLDAVLKEWKSVPKPALADIKSTLLEVWGWIKPKPLTALLVVGIVTIPGAVIPWVLVFIPGIGGLLGTILGLVFMLLSPLCFAAATVHMVRLAAGAESSVATAWAKAVRHAPAFWVSAIVAGLVAGLSVFGLLVGALLMSAFLGPVFFVEGKRFLDLNTRSLALARGDWLRIFVVQFLIMIAFQVPAIVVSMVLSALPIVGPLLVSLFAGLMSAAMMPLLAGVSARFYFARRAALGESDALSEARSSLAS